ncbi:OprD family outer membrane porin [Hyphomicrobium sp. D-2]|uniref:OprD family outer membrane porin n=1 Tax=Hyphomicrobium sp. D-2 TaxID=3041621 RepID=UPI002458B61F|nr:OprD family outer membrane porin [Hyphomicrobium sp. D-2]MDH4980784.1 OprD family outer membrane porin [Hyphomicrobium sp. D-2]
MVTARRQASVARASATLLRGAIVLALLGVMPTARAGQDDATVRIPSSAREVYSPIDRTFDHQPALPGGPRHQPTPDVDAEATSDREPVLLQDLKQRLRTADPFFRDMKASLYLRTQPLDRDNATGPPSRAWAAGTALAIETGFYDDWLQLQAAVATSQPLWAPAGEGGTLLLTENQAEVSSIAIANARLRGFGQQVVIGRQLIKTPYINPQDNRIIPNSFEGITLLRSRDEAQIFDYGFAYLWGFKARDSSHFNSFSEALGVAEDRGVFLGGAKYRPARGLTIGAINYLIPDVVNTAYGAVDWFVDLKPIELRFNVGFTDQRTVGSNLLPGAPYNTHQITERFAASYANATIFVSGSHNSSAAALKSPFGSFPTYTTLDQLNFNDAGQQAIVIGAAYDFSKILIDGIKAQTFYGWSWGAIEPQTGNSLGRQNEFNIELEYAPSQGPLRNLSVQVFHSAVAFPDNPPGETQQPQTRALVTYRIPLL